MAASLAVIAQTSLSGWPAWAAPGLRLLLWLDASPTRYWVTIGALLVATAGLAMLDFLRDEKFPTRSRRGLWNAVAFWFLAAVTLFAGRWPEVFLPVAFNADENLFLAQALTALRDPIPWRGFEGHTAGPLNAYALLPAAWLGFPLRYVSARLIALALELGGVACLVVLVRWAFEARVSRLAALPALAFFTLTNFNDFVFYSSEHVPAFLAALGFTLTAGLLWTKSPRHLLWLGFCAGGVLGLAPYAKLQSAPVAGMTALAGLIFLRSRQDLAPSLRWRAAAAFVAGGAAFTFLLCLVLLATGVFVDFYNSYLLMQLEYIGNATPKYWVALLNRVPDFWCFFLPSILFAIVGGIWLLRCRSARETRLLLGAALAVLGASFYEVQQPHREYGHYLFLALLPTATLSACTFAALDKFLRSKSITAPWRATLALGFIFISMAPLIVLRATTEHPFFGRLSEYLQHPPIPALVHLQTFTRPGEPLAVWGWMAECQVFTGTTLGTRDPQSEHEIIPSRLRGYYRRRYVADLKKNRPPVFVDAITPVALAYSDRAKFGLETFPVLAQYIAENYTLRDEIDGLRIFVRNDLHRP